MPSYLVSFTMPGGRVGVAYGSHVVSLSATPSTSHAAVDIWSHLVRQYGTNQLALLNWDLLPDEQNHPGKSSPYGYFVTYFYAKADSEGYGSEEISLSAPIITLQDLRQVEERIRSRMRGRDVHLVACKILI